MEKIKGHDSISRLLIMTTLAMVLPFYVSVPLFLLTIIYMMRRDPGVWRRNLRKNMWILLFIGLSMLVALVHQNYIGMGVSCVFLLFAYYFNYYRDWIRAHIYLRFLHFNIMASGLLALYAIFIYLKYSLTHNYGIFYIFNYNNIQTRAEATLFNANYYGLYCLFAIAMILYMYRKIKVGKVRLTYQIILLLNIIAIILTGSRWLWPSVVFVIGVFYLMLNLSWLKYILGLVMTLIMAIIVKPNILPRVESLAHAFKDRWTLWSGGIGLFLWRPIFGTGAMTYMQYYYLFTDNGNMHSHSLFIDILANFGLVGVGLILLAVWSSFRFYRPLLHNKECRLELVFMVTIALTILFHGVMDVAILWVQTAYIALMILMLPPQEVLALSQIQIDDNEDFDQHVALFPGKIFKFTID